MKLNNTNSLNSYQFRSVFAISNQTLTNWERRGKIKVERHQIHHIKFKTIDLNSINNIPKRYLNRIEILKKSGVLGVASYNLILKGFKN